MEMDVEAYLRRRYESQIADIEILEKEDLDLVSDFMLNGSTSQALSLFHCLKSQHGAPWFWNVCTLGLGGKERGLWHLGISCEASICHS